jgi:hypothetical protein
MRSRVSTLLGLLGALAATPAPATAAEEPPRPRLRCWQEGRLLFEETGWRSLSASARPERVLHSRESPGAAFSLFDVGSATCLLERDAPPAPR